MNDHSSVRAANKALFEKLLGHLGRKEFDDFEACLAEDFVQVWPYLPLPSLPDTLHGRRLVRQTLEAGMSDFAPYQYEQLEMHDMLDPNVLLAEYRSRSHFYPRNLPYQNRYISLLRFADGCLVHWTEYVNPLIVKDTLGADFDRTIADRTGKGSS